MTGRGGNHLISVDQIVEMMSARIRELVQAWQLQGHEDGNDFVALNPLRADRNAGSFRVCLRGQYQGLVKDFAGGDAWSPLSFTAKLMFAGDNVAAIKWAKAWLGLDGTDPASLKQTRAAVQQRNESADADAEKTLKQKRDNAYRLLKACRPLDGTPAAAYLAARGIGPERFARPLGLHFHPGLRTLGPAGPLELPAMVAPVWDFHGKLLALHRTFLDVPAGPPEFRAGDAGRYANTVRKTTKLPKAKKVTCAFAGGVIPLWRGERVDPATGEVKAGLPLGKAGPDQLVAVTEGIEDGLSVALLHPALRVFAGVALDNIGAIRWPDNVSVVELWRQNDPPGGDADRALGRVIEKILGQGRRVRVVKPPAGVKDINELVMKTVAGQREDVA